MATTTIVKAPISKTSPLVAPRVEDEAVIQRLKNELALHLLAEWLADESGDDEQAWETVKQSIETHRLSERSRFHA